MAASLLPCMGGAQAPGASGQPGAAPATAPDARAASTAAKKASDLLKAGKTSDALAELDAALKASPRDAQLRFLYGVTVAGLGRTREAIDVFQQLTEDFPELPEPHNNLAVMLAAAGNLDGARAALESAVRALPGYALAHENLGDVYLRMAVRSWERALALNTSNAALGTRLTLARELLARIAPGQATATPQAPAAR